MLSESSPDCEFKFNPGRNFRMALVGFAIAPFAQYWYVFMDRHIKTVGVRTIPNLTKISGIYTCIYM